MAREPESVHEWTEDRRFSLRKEKTVIRCDDGTVYEFEQAEGNPSPRLVRGFKPNGRITHLDGGRLPSAVKETAKDLLGGFTK